MNLIQHFKKRFRSYDPERQSESLSQGLLHEILASINWTITLPQFSHLEEILKDFRSSNQVTESEYERLFEKLSDLTRETEAGYGHDIPHDYIGIGGELL